MRALVSIFAALLIVISLYQLSFTWFVNKHESAMEAKAKQLVSRLYPVKPAQKYPGNKEAQASYQDTLDQAFNLKKDSLLKATGETKITWWGTTYQKSKEDELLLGLDLQGGISVTLNIALDGLIKNMSNNPRDPQLLRAISMAQQKELTNNGNLIDLFAESFKESNPTGKLAPLFANANRNKLTFDASDAAVISYLHDQAGGAMRQTYQVINQRINQFGVAQPSISLDENRAIINVELAGATDPDRVRNYLQSTANLQFWEVYTLQDLQNYFVNADKALQNYLNGVKADSTVNDSTAKKDTLTNIVNQNALFRVLQPLVPRQDRSGQSQSYSAVAISNLRDTAKVNGYLNLPVVRNSLHDSNFAFNRTFAPAVSSFIIANNIKVAAIAFAGGMTLGIATLWIVLNNGLMIGGLGAMFAARGFGADFWATIAPHGVLELSAIQISAAAGLLLAKGVVAPGRLRRIDALKANARRAAVLMVGVTGMLVIAGIIEGFLTPQRTSIPFRFAVGALTALLLIAYFTFAGRAPEAANVTR